LFIYHSPINWGVLATLFALWRTGYFSDWSRVLWLEVVESYFDICESQTMGNVILQWYHCQYQSVANFKRLSSYIFRAANKSKRKEWENCLIPRDSRYRWDNQACYSLISFSRFDGLKATYSWRTITYELLSHLIWV